MSMSNDEGSDISIETEAECGSNPHLSDFDEPHIIDVTLAHSVISGYYDIPKERKEFLYRRRSVVKKRDYISRRDLMKNRRPKNSTEGIEPELKNLLLQLGKMNPSKPPVPAISPQEEAELARRRELLGEPKPILPPLKSTPPRPSDLAVAGLSSRAPGKIQMAPVLKTKDIPPLSLHTRSTFSSGSAYKTPQMNPPKPSVPTISPGENIELARKQGHETILAPYKSTLLRPSGLAVAGPSRPTRTVRMTPAFTSKDITPIPFATRNTYSPGRKGWRSIKEEMPKVVFVTPKDFEPPPRVADIYKVQRISTTAVKKKWTGPSKIPVTSHALDKKEGSVDIHEGLDMHEGVGMHEGVDMHERVDIHEGQGAIRRRVQTSTYILKKSPGLTEVQQHQPTPSKIPVKIQTKVALTKKKSSTNILQKPEEPEPTQRLSRSSSSLSSLPETLIPLLSDLELDPSKKKTVIREIMTAIKCLSSICPQKSLFPEDPNLATYIYELIVKSPEKSLVEGGGGDSPDLDFVYDDTDNHGNEISELYSYTEQPELQLNVKAFEDQMELYELPPSWQRLSVEKRHSVVMKLLDQLECSKKPLRMRSARCILYIAQGCWAEMQSDTEQQHWARINTMLLYQNGAFSAFTDLLNIEIENSTAAYVALRKIAVSLADSQDIRVILSVLYTITEVIRNEKASGNAEFKEEVDSFCFEIGNAYGDELLVIKLLGMVTKFCSGAAPHFPMKKVLLLLWKLLLVSLGGMTALKDMKAEKRKATNLSPLDEDTMEIARTMRASSPPASASDLLEAQNQKRNTRPLRRSLMKQSSLDDQETLGMEMEASVGSDNGEDLPDMTEYDERRPSDNNETGQIYNNHNVIGYNRPLSPALQHEILPRGLPWKPKVRQKDIDSFLDAARMKFVGYTLPGDNTTLFGLPEPIHEGLRILNEHVYTSLAELQIQKEEEIARNPMSTKEDEVELTPAEILYQAMLPNLPQYMIALLKILLAAAPTSRAKTDSINILADVLPEEMPMTVLQSMKLGIDVNRHKEIIVKAVSAILLLLLKHFKLNHVYQFEFMSQHLVFANCIPLVLKFFNQNIMAYVGAKNVIPILDFPACVIGDQPELTTDSLEIGDAAPYSWRNMFSCINLLRILNKLTKWKHSRIMMLVVFKSAPILKRTLKVRHAMTQLYVLKLLKMQTKYLGRQWRKSNMKTISAIYGKVRHRLNDDWAYGNDLDARPWDFQAEECALRASVDRFNNRRYTSVNDSEFEPVDNCLSSVLGAKHELSDNFKKYYSLWLEQEVFGTPIEWDRLLQEDTE